MAYQTSGSLCWSCKNACGGCSWSDSLTPVEGWTADEALIKGSHTMPEVPTWSVRACPQFAQDCTLTARKKAFHRPDGDSGGYLTLAAAIIKEACKDYKMAIKTGNGVIRREVERFFLGDYFKQLSDLDPQVLMRSLRELVKEEDL